MDWLLVLAWAALVYTLFTLLRLRVNPWTVGVAVLAGMLAIGALVATMTQAQPYSGRLRLEAPAIAIVPVVGGRVAEVPVRPGAAVKAGDVLFRVDPTPYELTVAQRKATLAEAEQRVTALKAAQEVARDDAGRAAQRAQADAAVASVLRLQAELALAEHELAQTVVRAPAAGYVAEATVRPGAHVTAGATTAAMSFVQDAPGDRVLSARFRSLAVQRVRIGDEAEIAFDAVAGRVFKARVRTIAAAVPPSQTMAAERRRHAAGTVVTFDLIDDGGTAALAAGATGAAAIYTDQAPSVAVVRRILLRMRSWLSYVCG